MSPPSRPQPDEYDRCPEVKDHFSTTPQLTPLAPDHYHAERAQTIQTKLQSLYEKHGLQRCRFYGLYYLGTRAQLTCLYCDRIMLVVLELTHGNIQKWRDFDAEVRQILRDHKPNQFTEICVRYYQRPASARPMPPRLQIPPTESQLNGIPHAPVLQNAVPRWAPGDDLSTYAPRSRSPVPDELSRQVARTRFGYYDGPTSPVAPPYSHLTPTFPSLRQARDPSGHHDAPTSPVAPPHSTLTPTGPSSLTINPIPSPSPVPRLLSLQPARNSPEFYSTRNVILRHTQFARSLREVQQVVESHVARQPLQTPTLTPMRNNITLEVGTPLADGTLLTESTPLYQGMQLADGTTLVNGMELQDGTVLERYTPSLTESVERSEESGWIRARIFGILRRVPRVTHGMFSSHEVVPQDRLGL